MTDSGEGQFTVGTMENFRMNEVSYADMRPFDFGQRTIRQSRGLHFVGQPSGVTSSGNDGLHLLVDNHSDSLSADRCHIVFSETGQ